MSFYPRHNIPDSVTLYAGCTSNDPAQQSEAYESYNAYLYRLRCVSCVHSLIRSIGAGLRTESDSRLQTGDVQRSGIIQGLVAHDSV